MAGQAERSLEEEILPHRDLIVRPTEGNEYRDAVRAAAAKLYGQGIKRPEIARIMVDHLGGRKAWDDGTVRPLEQRISQARKRLRDWEKDQKFRDMVYDGALIKLDLETPEILSGLARKAKRGRVDAARLALELTGRHTPKGEQQPTQVALVIQGIPRPSSVQAVTAEGQQTIEIMDGTEAPEDEDV